MFKKIISIFLMISIVIGLLCFNTSADENDFALVFEDDFEEYEVGYIPPSGKGDIKKWTSVVKSDASPVIVKEYNGNKFLSLGRETNQTESAGPRVEKQLSVKTDSFVRLYLKVQTNGQIFQLSLRNLDNTKHTTIFNFSGDTLLSTVPDGIELKSDEFVDLQVDINFKEMKYTSYINGSVYESNGTVNSDISVEDGFRIRYGTSISPGNELFLDDVKIYTDDIGLIGGKIIDILSLKTNSDQLLTPYIKESHPKIYVNDFEAIKEKIKTDEIVAKWYSAVKANANTILGQEPEQYAPEDGILTNSSRRIMYKLYVLAFVYAVEDNDRYKERALEEIRNADNFPSWHPNNFLGVAELGGGIAVAYDWMYNGMTEEEREYVRGVILDKTLYLGALSYEGISDVFFVTATSNWNFVCNGGIVLSALAISEDYPQLADYIFNKAAESIPYATEITFAPQGASPEGPGYWNYAAYNFMNMIAAIDSATVDGMKIPAKFDFSDTPGLSTTLDFPIATHSSVGRFNYGDNVPEYGKGIDLFSAYWVAEKYNNIEYAKYQLKTRDLKGVYTPAWKNVLKIIWYNPSLFENTDYEFPLDKFYTHDSGPNLVTLRSGWDNEIYVGMQGGLNGSSHSFLSLGTFIIDALGERWATLIGQGNYRWEGYFSMGDQRWTYYNCNTEGQNCVVLNPDDGPQQNITALAKTVDSYSSADESYGVLDMSAAYDTSVNKYLRGVKLFDGKSRLVIQDDISAKEPIKNGYWFMHTDATVTVADDGKSALLVKNGKKMHMQIVSDFENAKFTYVDAKPLPTSQNPEIQQAEDYGKKLSIDLAGAKDIKLAVVFTPLDDGINVDDIDYNLVSINEWSKYDESTGTTVALWDGSLRYSTGEYAVSALPLLGSKNFYGIDTLPDYDSNYNVGFTVRNNCFGTGVTNTTENDDKYYVFNWSDVQNNYRKNVSDFLSADTPVLSFSYDTRIPLVGSNKQRSLEITFTNDPKNDTDKIRSKFNIIYDDNKFSVNTENMDTVISKTKTYTPDTWVKVEVRAFINDEGKLEAAVYVGDEQIYYGTGDIDYSNVFALRQINFKTETTELSDGSVITYDTHYDDIKISKLLPDSIPKPAIMLTMVETSNGVESKAKVLVNNPNLCMVTAVFDESNKMQKLWIDTTLEDGFFSIPITDSQYLKAGYVVKSFVFNSLQSAIPQVKSKDITLTSE